MNSKEHILFSEWQSAKCALRSLLFFILLLFAQVTFSQNNEQYDLNDPRNPDCPCHKLQKQAEEEFAQLDNAEVKKEINNTDQEINKLKVSPVNTSTSGSASSVRSGNRHPNRKKLTWISKLKFRYSKKIKRIKIVRPDYSVCYRW